MTPQEEPGVRVMMDLHLPFPPCGFSGGFG